MERFKLCVVINSRGNYAKLKPIIDLVKRDRFFELQVVVGGGVISRRYGEIDIPHDKKCYFLVEGGTPFTMAKSAGYAANDFAVALNELKPDAVMLVGDRYEVLPIAMVSAYMNIPVIHLEGGEVSGSIDESIRHAVTKLSHLHFPCTELARKRIVFMGESPDSVFNVGATSLDVLRGLDLNDLNPLFLFQTKTGVGETIDFCDDYMIVIYHPVTTEYGNALSNVKELASAVLKSGVQAVWLWPNFDAGTEDVAKGMREFREIVENAYFIRFFTGVPIEIYGPMLKNASCIVGNSSSGIRESAFLGVPCVNIGSRQNNRERGKNVYDVPCNTEQILDGIRLQMKHGRYESSHLYGDGRASGRIVQKIKSFKFNVQKELSY